jgi:predicted nucleic acid-binding Zn ribbon protein
VQAGTLIVSTRSSGWCQEFSFQKVTILRRYRERLGKEFIKDLRFVVGPVRGVTNSLARQAPPEEEVRRIQLSPPEIERIRKASETGDMELGQAIRRALTHEAQLHRWHLEHGARECPRCHAAYRSSQKLCPACRQDDATANERL